MRRKASFQVVLLVLLFPIAQAFARSTRRETAPAASSLHRHPVTIVGNERGQRVSTVLQGQADDVVERQSSKSIVLLSAATLLSACLAASVSGLLPGYVVDDILQTPLLLQDMGATLLTGLLGYLFVTTVTFLVNKEVIDSKDGRKIIHTGSAPLFILFWPMFTSLPSARMWAASVPMLNAVRLYLAGQQSGETKLAAAVSRTGDAKEAVGGPFIYVIMLASFIVGFWRDSPVGIVALCTMAAGDGLADLIGRRYGKTNKWRNSDKSISGSTAFWIGSALTSIGLLQWMQYATGSLDFDFSKLGLVFVVTFCSAVLEVIPWLGDDNYTVPISAAILSVVLLL